MIPSVGQQVLVNGRAGVIISGAPHGGLQIVTLFRPPSAVPPTVFGQPRASGWHQWCLVLLFDPAREAWFLETNQRVTVAPNPDVSRHIDAARWLDTFRHELRIAEAFA